MILNLSMILRNLLFLILIFFSLVFFLSGYNKLKNIEIVDNIYDDKAGMRDKDIAKLLDMKLGTVNTTYRRIVSKHIIDPYKIYKVNNE